MARLNDGSTGGASRFFLQHKELFEFDRYLGGDVSVLSSPTSLLGQYQECDRLAQQDAACIEPFFLAPLPAYHFTPLIHHSLQSVEAEPFFPASPPRRAPSLPAPAPPSPQHRPRILHDSPSLSLTDKPPLPSPTRHPPSPSRHFRHQPPAPRSLPKLDELLLDAAHRAVHFGPASKRIDDAKKIELLIGSKCVGRMSAAASSSLPPAIRRRLDASSRLAQRRERLYAALRDEYVALVGST